MLVCVTPEFVPWQPNFSSSEQADPDWTKLVCAGVEISNSISSTALRDSDHDGEVGVYLVGERRHEWAVMWSAPSPTGSTPDLLSTEAGGTTRWVAFGLIANDVEAVDLQFDDDSVAAVVGLNAFFYEGEGEDPDSVTAFVLYLNDGTVRPVTTNGA